MSTIKKSELDKIIKTAQEGLKCAKSLADTVDKVSNTLNNKSKADAANAEKLSKAEAEREKAKDNHALEMKKLEKEWAEIALKAEDQQKTNELIEKTVNMLEADYKQYLELPITVRCKPEINKPLETLRASMTDLATKMINSK